MGSRTSPKLNQDLHVGMGCWAQANDAIKLITLYNIFF